MRHRQVTKGEATADPAVVRLLQQLVAAAPRLPTESFGKMVRAPHPRTCASRPPARPLASHADLPSFALVLTHTSRCLGRPRARAQFNTQVQDMLTIVYLANLTRTQLALAEKLSAVSLSG